MESETLDFNDLVDNGDEFPGFEITKFTPANEKEENDDSILRTPEHEQDQLEDFNSAGNLNSDVHETHKDISNRGLEVGHSPGGNSGDNEPGDERSGIDDGKQEVVKDGPEINFDVSQDSLADDQTKPEVDENLDMECTDVTEDSRAVENAEKGDSRAVEKALAGDSKAVENAMDEDSREECRDESKKRKSETTDEVPALPTPKKKMYLMPPKSKMKLWGGNKPADSTENQGEKSSKEEPVAQTNGDAKSADEQPDSRKKEEEEEDPHQQSFLSFLNLKPGMSKPKEDGEKLAEKVQQEEFYSRKRLRTRKKVSYVYDDEMAGDDDDYVVEDDQEEDQDHYIDLTSPAKRVARARSSSKSPGSKSGAAGIAAGLTYAQALQNLLPGVDLSLLNQTTQQNVLHTLKPELAGLNKNILPKPGTSPNIGSVAAAGSKLGDKTGQNVKGLFECGLCGAFFGTANQFITHQEKVHNSERKLGKSAMETFRCEICNFVLTNRYAYLEHKKMKHNKSMSFACTKCKVSFAYVSELQKHQQVCGAPICTTCGATFKTWTEVGHHRITVHDAAKQVTRQWLSCTSPGCNFKCLTQHEMKIHTKNKHTASDMFGCNAPKCTSVFNTRDKLNAHKKEVHASEFIVQYQCVECKNCFSTKTLLAEHQYLHTMEKLRKCDLCSRFFSTFAELRRHREVHIVKGQFRCRACTRWCTDKTELINHVCAVNNKYHHLRIYFCDVCKKDFRSDEKMFEHRRDHKYFYQCGSCYEQCASEADYLLHRKGHGKHTCSLCYEEVDEESVDSHKEAHQYYTKMEDLVTDGQTKKVMYLHPNLLSLVEV